jgi:hypothetical protein
MAPPKKERHGMICKTLRFSSLQFWIPLGEARHNSIAAVYDLVITHIFLVMG